MALVTTSVPTLVNGVSQQAENLRFTSQCTEQVNGFSSVLRGLLKRPPTRHVKQVNDLPAKFQSVPVNRSPDEQFHVILGNKVLRVFDLEGTEYPVVDKDNLPITEAALAYLTTTTPEKSLKALTVADYTLIANREKTVAMDTTITPKLWPSSLVFIKQYRAATNYVIRLFNDPTASNPDFTFTYSTPTTASATDGNQELIASTLRSQIVANSAADALYAVFHSGPVMFITRKDNADFRVEAECGVPEGTAVFKDSAQNFSALPKKGWAGFQLKVKGDPEDEGDDYYVKYVGQAPAATGFAEGAWEESQGYGFKDSLNPATLPHALVNLGTGTFQFKPLTWASRKAGDDKSNPEPSLVGKKVRDLFFHKNRLGMLADENIVLSEAGEFFNFFRTTVVQLLDSDPIDVAASHSKIAILNSAVASSKKLVLFSEQTQFLLEAGDTLTPKTVSLPPVSEYENTPDVAPRTVGDSILFPFKRGEHSGFYDYAVESDTDLFKAFDVTEHAPSYLKGIVEAFDLSPTLNLIVAKTDAWDDTLFVYQFFKRRGERLQSAWHEWKFDGNVASFFILGTALYLVIERDGVHFFETIEMDVAVTDPDAEFTTHVDRRITDAEVTSSYNPITEQTTFELPFNPNPAEPVVVKRSTDTVKGGAIVPVVFVDGNTLRVVGDFTEVPLWFGVKYELRVKLTRPQLREQRQDGTFSILPGRFQVRRGFLSFNDSLAFAVTVTPQGRPSFTYKFVPRLLGTTSALTGSPPSPQDGVLRFPVNSKNDQVTIELVNDSPLPCALLSLDWEALYTQRAQKV